MINGKFVRVSKVDQQSSERTVLVSAKSSPANDRFGDSRFIAAMSALRMRANAASAIAAPAKGGKVRAVALLSCDLAAGLTNDRF